MTEIGFYHLTRSTQEEALAPLLGRTLEQGERAVVLCGSEARAAALDAALWRVREPAWLPHGREGVALPECQPIWLSVDTAAPNAARFAFLLAGVEEIHGLEGYARVFDLFDGGSEEALAAARKRWVAAGEAGFERAYWQQQPRGWKRAR